MGDWKVFIADDLNVSNEARTRLVNFLSIKKMESQGNKWVCIVFSDYDDFDLDLFQNSFHIDNLLLSLFDYVIAVDGGIGTPDVEFLVKTVIDESVMTQLTTVAQKLYAKRKKDGIDSYPDLNLVVYNGN